MPFEYTPQLINSLLTWEGYRLSVRKSIEEAANNPIPSKMLPYVKRNDELMDVFEKKYHVSDELHHELSMSAASTWLVIAEGWCGDAAYALPMFAAIQRLFPDKITFCVALRDTNPELIDANLTSNARSIPKLVVLDQNLIPKGSWGPRPASVHELVLQWKAEKISIPELISRTDSWYEQNSTREFQQELIHLLKGIN